MAKKTEKKVPQSKPKSNRGGRRPGAGAKPKQEKELRERLNAEVIQTLTTPEPGNTINPKSAAEKALAYIQQVMEGEHATDLRLKAAGMILDRVIGKPRMAVEVTDDSKQPQIVVYIPDNGRDGQEQIES